MTPRDLKPGDPVRVYCPAPDGVHKFWRSARFVRNASNQHEFPGAIVANVDGKIGLYLGDSWQRGESDPTATQRDMAAIAPDVRPPLRVVDEVDGGLSEAERAVMAQNWWNPNFPVPAQMQTGVKMAAKLVRAFADIRQARLGRDQVGDELRRVAAVIAGEIL